jgi:hypothetical protein
MSNFEATCEICGHKQKVDAYSNWTCMTCKQGYVYDEWTHIALTEEQRELLRKAWRDAKK